MKKDARYIKNRREMRIRKKKMRAYICMGILCFACIFSFWVGRNVGIVEAGKKQTEVAVMEDVNQGNVSDGQELDGVDQAAGAGDGQKDSTAAGAGDGQKDGTAAESGDGQTVGAGNKDGQTVGAGNKDGQAAGTDSVGNAGPGKGQSEQEKEPEIDKSGILLVNKVNKLPEDYEVTLKKLPDRTNQAAEEAYQPMCDMLSAARKEGLALEVCSSYRSVDRQKELFEEDMRKLVRQGYSYLDAYDEVAKETMPPGYSEHSTGLAFDLVSLGYQMLDARQEDTEENKWLQEHCAEYGFILRYPKGKEDITGVSYESWHFRYVGVEAAEYIMENGLTLEEFLEE